MQSLCHSLANEYTHTVGNGNNQVKRAYVSATLHMHNQPLATSHSHE